MRTQVKIYVGCVALVAIGLCALVARLNPAVVSAHATDAVILCVLAIAGEMLAYRAPRFVIGSIGYIPYYAAAVLVPNWTSVAAVTLIRALLELGSRREGIKRVLNIASHAVMESVVVLVYIGLRGRSLIEDPNRHSLVVLTRSYGFAALAAFMIGLVVNNVTIFSAIGLASGRRIRTVWLDVVRSTAVFDLLIGPLIFVFAWVYAAHGPFAAAAMWVPILGLRQVYSMNLELEHTNEELLELMVKSLEARDPYTSGHSRRVQHYSTIIARAIGLGDRQVQEIGRAALLHDVGKIHEKYAPVLAKQDKLTPDEWAIIQDHPIDGANLVATMTRLRDTVPAVRHHHENWDGSGYPDGLAGELIPLAARIIRFADTIDAMTTQRPYRAPLTEAQVRAEIIKWRGTQFDPMICDRLLSSPHWHALFAPSTKGEDVAPIRTRLAVVAANRPREAVGGRRA
jgi:putative nucleotidyltransferase with HDIG domain